MMNSAPEDYLWDGRGTPDSEVARLESLLGRYRLGELRQGLPALAPRRWWEPLIWSRGFRLAVAGAAVVLVLGGSPWAIRRIAEPDADCRVVGLAGEPRVDGQPLAQSGRAVGGRVVETGATARAEVRFGLVGHVTVFPDSRLRIVEIRRGHYRMALDHGKITARTLAPPFTFVVETPSATAYDLGCSFSLETDPGGSGKLEVHTGWVQLEIDEQEVLIPGGAMCLLRPGGRLGTPHFEDAGGDFRTALARYDFEQEDAAARAGTLAALLAAARPRDAFSLMQMLRASTGDERRSIVDRALELAPAPAGVTRAGLLRGDSNMMYAWQKQLGLGEVKRWWIQWRDLLPE